MYIAYIYSEHSICVDISAGYPIGPLLVFRKAQTIRLQPSFLISRLAEMRNLVLLNSPKA
jgi:hypothetical protein